MRCREVRCWLYSFRPSSSWPVDVIAHLQGCPKCPQLRTRLARIDEGTSRLAGPPSDGARQARLLDRIAVTPQFGTEKATPAPPRQPWPWLRYGGYLAGCAALIVLGVFIGRKPAHQADPVEIVKTVEVVREKIVTKEVPVEVVREKIVSVPAVADRKLFAALLERNADLVQASKSVDRIRCLLDMAEDCRRHALSLMAIGPRDTLPATIDLYGQLLREGVVAQLAATNGQARPGLQNLVRGRLNKMTLPEAKAGQPKIVADEYAALQNATQQAIELVDRPEEAAAKKPRTEPASPSSALVRFAIAHCAERDPINRADLCADCVQRLMPSMMLCLAEDAEPMRMQMGERFGTMIRVGIYGSLPKEPTPETKEQVSRLYQSAAQIVADLEEHLKQANADCRPALQRALDATQRAP